MIGCEQVKARLWLYYYDELSFEETEAVEAHLNGCESCRSAAELEREAQALVEAASQAEPSSALLADCRRGLRTVLASERASVEPWWRRLAAGPLRNWSVPVGALAMLTLGFTGGRALTGRSVERAASQPVVATRVRDLQPQPGGEVRIVLEEVRQRQVRGSATDDNIRELLLAASRQSEDAGVRVESMDLLRMQSATDSVRQALMDRLEKDENPGVRLKALEGLRSHAADPDVQLALSRVLLRDDNPGIRTQAIDLLVSHRSKTMVGVLQEISDRESNDYVREQTRRALRAMGASVETF